MTVQVEDTELVESTADGSEELTINILREESICVGLDVRPVGCDVQTGDVVLNKGTTLGAVEVGVAAGVGVATVKVYGKPTVGLLSTGNSVV